MSHFAPKHWTYLRHCNERRGTKVWYFPICPGIRYPTRRFLKYLKRFAPGCTVHGLRSTFKDWSTEETEYPDDLSEAALAHVDSNKVRAAYKRSNLLEKRRKLMKDWAEFLGCAAKPANTVA